MLKIYLLERHLIMLKFFFNKFIFIYIYSPVYLLKVLWANYYVSYIVKNRSDCSIISKRTIANIRSTDKVFIIGTGTSINRLDSEDWKYISNYDSIGLNFSFLHQHVSKIQLVQLPYKSTLNMEKMILGLNKKMENYPTLITILRSSIQYFSSVKIEKYNEIKLFNIPKFEAFIPYRNKKLFQVYFKLVNSLFDPLLIQSRGGALTSAILLATKLGYKEIELVGINDGNSHYFYHESKDSVDSDYIEFVPDSESMQKTRIHGHFINSLDAEYLSTDDVISLLKKILMNSKKITINYFRKN